MRKTINKVEKTTTTSNEERHKQLEQLFPECLTEGKIDLEKLDKILNLSKVGGGKGQLR